MAVVNDLIRSRFKGALVGALVGDCFGAPFERINERPSSILDRIEQMAKDEKVLNYTDDTAMSLSTCNSLIINKGLDPGHLAKEFAESYFKEPNRGYGSAVKTVFTRLRATKYQDPYGPAASQFDGNGSYGNGAAMRCVGIGLFAHKMGLDEQKTIELSEGCGRITHSHKNGVNGANLLVLAVKYVLELASDESLDDTKFLDYLISRITKLEDQNTGHVYSDKLKSIARVIERLTISGQDVNQMDIICLLGNDVAAHNSVPLAIYSFLRGISRFTDSYKVENEFLRTLHWAISCGGDTDTIASMSCGLCGAYLGLDKIPTELYNRCESHLEIIALADRMVNL